MIAPLLAYLGLCNSHNFYSAHNSKIMDIVIFAVQRRKYSIIKEHNIPR